MKKKHCRYRPPDHPQHDLALIKVKEQIKFSPTIMPICLPPTKKFPDETGIVYVAGWGLHRESRNGEDCTTNEKGPDPFSKCKFPFFSGDTGLSSPFTQCMKINSPSHGDKGCRHLYKLMKERQGNRTSFIDQHYGRVNTTDTASNHYFFDFLISNKC